MQFIDLGAQQNRIRKDIERRLISVLDHGQYIMGPEVFELEDTLAKFVGVKHAVSCASGTDALLMALMAFDIGSGDAVLTSPFSFFATAEVISLLGATPIFVDIDPDTFNIDPKEIEKTLKAIVDGVGFHPIMRNRSVAGLRPKAVIPVDLFGLPADYNRINPIAQQYGLNVIEDAAQSFGAEYHGRMACSLADVACTSFYPAKPLGAYGDGGMCFTDSDDIVDQLKSIRIHGMGNHQYDNVRIGINGRMDTMQAAILLSKFEIFSEEVELRDTTASTYSRLLEGSNFQLPSVERGLISAWAQYSLLATSAEHRSAIRDKLSVKSIPTAIYYPKPLHLQSAFTALGYEEGDFPVSENIANRIFSIPMHPYLTDEEQKSIAALVNSEP